MRAPTVLLVVGLAACQRAGAEEVDDPADLEADRALLAYLEDPTDLDRYLRYRAANIDAAGRVVVEGDAPLGLPSSDPESSLFTKELHAGMSYRRELRRWPRGARTLTYRLDVRALPPAQAQRLRSWLRDASACWEALCEDCGLTIRETSASDATFFVRDAPNNRSWMALAFHPQELDPSGSPAHSSTLRTMGPE